ncbi:beta-trans-bergamotene synthase [Microdochium nivale]|nr:beta-trans-bergamotene synthase [Microdochium nivale]
MAYTTPSVSFVQPTSTSTTGKKSPLYHLHTRSLFTKSDFKTVILPQTVFAVVAAVSTRRSASSSGPAAPILQPLRVALMLLWLWAHLLVENIANQRPAPAVLEDTVNKPWWPVPAGRITSEQCQAVLRHLVPACLLGSWLFDNACGSCGVTQASALLMCMVWLYNDLGADSAGPLLRNALNAVGLALFGWGALVVLTPGGGGGWDAPPMAQGKLQVWTLLVAAVVMTTVHAQDFPGVEGDAERGRQTMPLRHGQRVSRWALAVACPVWSAVCLRFWEVGFGLWWVPLLAVSGTIASLTLFGGNLRSDKMVWRLWCLWMVLLFILPLLGDTV